MRAKRKSQHGELSSASSLLHGMRMPGSKFPGHLVVREVRKGKDDERVIHYYGGGSKKTTKQGIYRLARDRGFDISHRRFVNADPEEQQRMLVGSLRWQSKAKARWMQRAHKELKGARSKKKRYEMQQTIQNLTPVVPKSPLAGDRPVSSYLRRYWE